MARTIPQTPYICIPDDFQSPISDYMSCSTCDDKDGFLISESALQRIAGRHLEEPSERPLGESPGRPQEGPPGTPLEEPPEGPQKEPFEGPLKEQPGRPLGEPPRGPLKEPHGGPLEEAPGKPLDEPPGGTLEEPPERVLEEPLSNLVEDESFNELTAALPLGKNLENNDPTVHMTENKVSQKKRSISESSSQRKSKESTSRKKIKRQRKKSDKKLKTDDTDIFPVHIICTKKGEEKCLTYLSSYINSSSKRKLPSSASENERETKKQSKQTLKKSNMIEKRATSKYDGPSTSKMKFDEPSTSKMKFDEPSTSKMKFDETRMSCDDQYIIDVTEAHSMETACSTLKSSQLSPEVTNPTSTKEFSEKDLGSCSSNNVNETAKIQYIKGCESSSNLSADDEDDDVPKTHFLSNAFVRRHKNSDHLSRESSDSPEEGHLKAAVQLCKNNLKPFQTIKSRKKKLDREKSSEDSGYPNKIKHLRKMIKHVLPTTKELKQKPKKILEYSPEASEDVSCSSLNSDNSLSNSSNETSESEDEILIDSGEDKSPLKSGSSNTHESISSDNSFLSESSDHTLLFHSDEENPDEDQCVPKGTPITIEEKSSGSNADRSPMSPVSRMVRNNENIPLTSLIEQSPERYLANISDESKSEDDQCVPSGSPIKITNEKSASPNVGRSSINTESRTDHISENISSNITTATEQSLINMSNETGSQEEQRVLKSEKESHKKMKMKGDECNEVSQIEIAVTRRRNAISNLATLFCANHPWRRKVYRWIRSVYPDLVSDDSEPEPVTADPAPEPVTADPVPDSVSSDPVPDSLSASPVPEPTDLDPNLTTDQPEVPNVNLENMQSDEYYVDSIGNTLEVASETFVTDRVDEADDQLYCRKPQPGPSPSNLSADDELTDNESENEK